MATRDEMATSFGAAAGAYDEGRPDYPAEAVARFLEGRTEVSRTRYPTLESHPQRELAMRQMSAGGTMVTFDLAGARFGLATCYDMRFPEQFTALARRGAHAILLPTSILGGALVICAADLAARTMIGDADLPLGMFTALIGGPAFFILLRRSRRAGAGWSARRSLPERCLRFT